MNFLKRVDKALIVVKLAFLAHKETINQNKALMQFKRFQEIHIWLRSKKLKRLYW